MQIPQVKVPDWAVPLYDHIRYKILYGGRSSGKTWQIARALVIQSYVEPLRIICMREHKTALRKSAKPAIEDAIRGMKLPSYKSSNEDIRHRNGTWFSFEGASTTTEEEVKGWEGCNRCWFEEAHRMSLRSRNLIYPTIFRRDDSEFWASYNPQKRTDPIHRDSVTGTWGEDSRYVCHINYDVNPWFPKAEEMLRLEWEKSDPQTYAHEWLGYPDDSGAGRQVLPYEILQDCVKAYKNGLAPERSDAPAVSSRARAGPRCARRPALRRPCAGGGHGDAARRRPLPVLDLGVTRSLSRPQVSDDNPLSEAQFKTLKCHPGFPGRFHDITAAIAFCRTFFPWYNTEHRHGGIAMLTPYDVHHNRTQSVLEQRGRTLQAAWTRHPERFVRGIPQPDPLPQAVWINPPVTPTTGETAQ